MATIADTARPTDAAAEGRSRSLWRHSDFLKLWGGETVSLFGSQITALALPLTAITALHVSPIQLGVLNALGFAPFLLVTLVAGVWVDHHRRRPVLVWTNLGRAALIGAIPLLAWMGALRIGYLFALWFCVGALTVFFHLAYQALVPTVIAPGQLVDGNSKLTASESIAEVGGPGVGGALIQVIAAPFALALDAASFVVAGLSVAWMRGVEPAPHHSNRSGGGSAIPNRRQRLKMTVREIADGLSFTFRDSRLRACAGEALTYNVFWQVIQTVFLLYAVRELRLQAGVIGVILACGSVGGLLGALVTGRAARRFGVGVTIVGSSLVSCVVPLALPFVRSATPGATVALALTFGLTGLGVTACNIHTVSLRQIVTPTALFGRMQGSYRFLTYGAVPLGALLGGALGQIVGLRVTLLVGALGLACAWLWLLHPSVRRLRSLRDAPPLHATPTP